MLHAEKENLRFFLHQAKNLKKMGLEKLYDSKYKNLLESSRGSIH
jgi:hypothetical protein